MKKILTTLGLLSLVLASCGTPIERQLLLNSDEFTGADFLFELNNLPGPPTQDRAENFTDVSRVPNDPSLGGPAIRVDTEIELVPRSHDEPGDDYVVAWRAFRPNLGITQNLVMTFLDQDDDAVIELTFDAGNGHLIINNDSTLPTVTGIVGVPHDIELIINPTTNRFDLSVERNECAEVPDCVRRNDINLLDAQSDFSEISRVRIAGSTYLIDFFSIIARG